MQCACAATDFPCNETLTFVNDSGRYFSPIFAEFGTQTSTESEHDTQAKKRETKIPVAQILLVSPIL